MFTRGFANGLTTGIALGLVLGLTLAQRERRELLSDVGRRLGNLVEEVTDRGRRLVGQATESLDELVEM